MKAFCYSANCAGTTTFRPVEKQNISKSKISCPDCNSILVWAKERKNTRNMTAGASNKKKEMERYVLNNTAI